MRDDGDDDDPGHDHVDELAYDPDGGSDSDQGPDHDHHHHYHRHSRHNLGDRRESHITDEQDAEDADVDDMSLAMRGGGGSVGGAPITASTSLHGAGSDHDSCPEEAGGGVAGEDARDEDGRVKEEDLAEIHQRLHWLGLGIISEWLEAIEKNGEQPNGNFWAIIQRFISWLKVPEVEAGKHASMYTIKERNLVRQRRITLLAVTAYSILLRYVSFDFFIFLLFVSNATLLYALKNSRRLNVQMAKRTVKQRVGWAKQYLGGILSLKQKHAHDPIESRIPPAVHIEPPSEGSASSPAKTAPRKRLALLRPRKSTEDHGPQIPTHSGAVPQSAGSAAASQNIALQIPLPSPTASGNTVEPSLAGSNPATSSGALNLDPSSATTKPKRGGFFSRHRTSNPPAASTPTTPSSHASSSSSAAPPLPLLPQPHPLPQPP
ncbi:hypothetical protein BDK51DRAFT_48244, partial [Blyttiomyces helicus]